MGSPEPAAARERLPDRWDVILFDRAPGPALPATAARTSFAAPPLDPEAVPRNAFNLRLNDYELHLLRRAAAQTRPKQSMQQVIKQGLIPYLERLVGVR